ncbi:HAMP domain-containing histidine kinase [Desulfosarcina sp. OttesenSCG-928-B08]|nr:HAMP domain-containing histidine kinase [Desulfosarcina sp. OttesenSCG-928-B08]
MMVFGLLLTAPLVGVSVHTYTALNREADAQMRFFAGQLLDDMETELAERVRAEEARTVDEYQQPRLQDGQYVLSPLSRIPDAPFIIGYFQNNPDGTFHTPLVANPDLPLSDAADRLRRLSAFNTAFNQRKTAAGVSPSRIAPVPKNLSAEKREEAGFADRYLNLQKTKKQALGQAAPRKEAITASQAMQVAGSESRGQVFREDTASVPPPPSAVRSGPAPTVPAADREREIWAASPAGSLFQVEVAPLQAVALDPDHVFIFRRVDISGRIYRQGFVLALQPFLNDLVQRHYDSQPLSRYAGIRLRAAGMTISRGPETVPDAPETANWVITRTFPSPFGFLLAEMRGTHQAPSPARRTFTLVLVFLGGILIAGLFSIYQGARSVMDLSERRSRFVSTVTHELKTPLTTIRMYIEMLEQGIAATPEQEQTYLGILSSESARLSGLINNVLELSRLEKKTRPLNMASGDLSDVLADVRAIMGERLLREGFILQIRADTAPLCFYDREGLVQILINLVENSIKFGVHQPEKRIVIAAKEANGGVEISVHDTGPGIPKPDLARVFDEFYRVDNDLTRSTAGTGIGLALVKRLAMAMGGRVRAVNNAGAGCTIIIRLSVG